MKHFLHAALITSARGLGFAFAACGGDDKKDDDKADASVVVSDAGHSAADASSGDDASVDDDASVGGDASIDEDASSGDDASVGDAGSGCTSDTDCPNASCKTSSGQCIEENAQCAAHSNCGDTQFCDLSGLTGESIFGVCKTGERPANGLACGEESLQEGDDCESGMAIDGADAKAYCTCECETADTCPASLPTCNAWLGMCIYKQNQ